MKLGSHRWVFSFVDLPRSTAYPRPDALLSDASASGCKGKKVGLTVSPYLYINEFQHCIFSKSITSGVNSILSLVKLNSVKFHKKYSKTLFIYFSQIRHYQKNTVCLLKKLSTQLTPSSTSIYFIYNWSSIINKKLMDLFRRAIIHQTYNQTSCTPVLCY